MKKGVRIGEPEAMCHLEVMPSLGLEKEPIPLWWTGDFILASPEGTPAEEEKWIIGEFNCSCVGAPCKKRAQGFFQFLASKTAHELILAH